MWRAYRSGTHMLRVRVSVHAEPASQPVSQPTNHSAMTLPVMHVQWMRSLVGDLCRRVHLQLLASVSCRALPRVAAGRWSRVQRMWLLPSALVQPWCLQLSF